MARPDDEATAAQADDEAAATKPDDGALAAEPDDEALAGVELDGREEIDITLAQAKKAKASIVCCTHSIHLLAHLVAASPAGASRSQALLENSVSSTNT